MSGFGFLWNNNTWRILPIGAKVVQITLTYDNEKHLTGWGKTVILKGMNIL